MCKRIYTKIEKYILFEDDKNVYWFSDRVSKKENPITNKFRNTA